MPAWYVHSGHNQTSLRPLIPSAYSPNDQPQQEQGQEQPQARLLLTHEMLLHGVVGRTPDHGGVLAPTDPSALVRPFLLLPNYRRGVLTFTTTRHRTVLGLSPPRVPPRLATHKASRHQCPPMAPRSSTTSISSRPPSTTLLPGNCPHLHPPSRLAMRTHPTLSSMRQMATQPRLPILAGGREMMVSHW